MRTAGTLAGAMALALASAAYAADAVGPQDKKFVMDAAHDGVAEVALAKVAAAKAASPEVKSYAEMLMNDHTKANNELKELAQSKGITVPEELAPQHKALHSRLEKLSGEQFDRAYMEAMVKDHRKAVALFKRESTSGKDPDLKGFASKTVPTLEHHLKQAQDLAGKTKTGKEPTAGRK
jgi:putative membrane protein